jgi:hypothetical protein
MIEPGGFPGGLKVLAANLPEGYTADAMEWRFRPGTDPTAETLREFRCSIQ